MVVAEAINKLGREAQGSLETLTPLEVIDLIENDVTLKNRRI